MADSPFLPDSHGAAALRLAGLGFAVFPCVARGKVPATKSGFKDATTDAATITKWWLKEPVANVAVACGASGLVVVDADGDVGLANLRRALASLGLDETALVRGETGGGGLHLFFLAPSTGDPLGCRANILGGKVDVKAAGGYVVVPPSVHPSGAFYKWVLAPWDAAVVEIPPELARLLATSPAAKPAPTTAHDAPRHPRAGKGAPDADGTGPIAEGLRNDTLTSLAGAMRRRGFTSDAILAALRITNNEKCRPPLPDEDLVRIANSVARYDPEPVDYNFTDSGNAELFAARHGHLCRYSGRYDIWIVWNENRWHVGHNDELTRRAVETARARGLAAYNVKD